MNYVFFLLCISKKSSTFVAELDYKSNPCTIYEP